MSKVLQYVTPETVVFGLCLSLLTPCVCVCVCVCSTALDEQARVAHGQAGALRQGAISSHQKHHTPPKRISH
jgi:hypothetical protein